MEALQGGPGQRSHEHPAPQVDQGRDASRTERAGQTLANHRVTRLTQHGSQDQQLAQGMVWQHRIVHGGRGPMTLHTQQDHAAHRQHNPRPGALGHVFSQPPSAQQGHGHGRERQDHAGRHGRGALHPCEHAQRKEHIAQQRLDEQPAMKRWRERRFIGRFSQPVRHGHGPQGKAVPGQHRHPHHRDQVLGQGDVTADQRHAGGQAEVMQAHRPV